MPHYPINNQTFPEIAEDSIPDFKKFLEHEFSGYVTDNELYAHNDGDSHWFTKQYIDAKNGNGIYQDWFKYNPEREDSQREQPVRYGGYNNY